MTVNHPLNPSNLRIVLVLQGGGALGAYQAGVYQALHEHDLVPDWIVGTSIGAINAALIAGNKKSDRLHKVKAFWDRVSHPDLVNMASVNDDQRRWNIWFNTADNVMRGVAGFFAPRLLSTFALGLPVAPEQASYYDTEPLAATLDELIDFDYLNGPDGMRLTVNAVKVKSGELAHFDSLEGQLTVDHVRASGALPPAFPPVRIGGDLYWDGGLYSNTPLESVLDDHVGGDTLCFMVDLWSAEGEEPTTLDEVHTRQKDVTFASRSKRHIDDYVAMCSARHNLRALYKRIPPSRRNAEDEQAMRALGQDNILHIVRLPYSGRDWHMASKDVNFSKGSIEWRWDQGYGDAMRAIAQAGWMAPVAPDTSIVVHELPPHPHPARKAD